MAEQQTFLYYFTKQFFNSDNPTAGHLKDGWTATLTCTSSKVCTVEGATAHVKKLISDEKMHDYSLGGLLDIGGKRKMRIRVRKIEKYEETFVK